MRQTLLSFILASLVFNTIDAQIQIVTKDKINYELRDGRAYILGFDEKATKVTIVSEITIKKRIYKVAGIKTDDYYAKKARRASAVHEMVFAEGVTQVFGRMAEKMEMLEKVVLPSTVTSIDREAFWGCKNLVEINIPDGVKSIGSLAFASCSSLQNLELPNDLQEIGGSAFSNCFSLKAIKLPQGLKSIGVQAFSGCSSLQEIVIPPSVNSLGKDVFLGCSGLKTSILLCDVDELPESFLSGCTSLESFVVPNSVKIVGVQTFKGCTSLTNIILPDNAKYRTDQDAAKIKGVKIYKGSFYGCNNLTNIKCHNGSVPPDILTYIPATCPYAKNGGMSDNPDFDTPLLASIAKHIKGISPNTEPHLDKPDVTVNSDVDTSIPKTNTRSETTYAIIIGNEDYKLVPSVMYAKHDADIFAEYCAKTLGLPQKNMTVIHNASFAEMIKATSLLKDLSGALKDKINVIFYYSGHGIPNEKTHDAYLLPVDVDGSITEVCYAVSRLYKELEEINAHRTLVFLDACFSGAQRNGGVLQSSARGVAIAPRDAVPLGNMVVYSASSGDETAYPYEEKGHGLFTYYLLKKIKESKGNVTLEDLADYIKENVSSTAVKVNKKSQTPTVTPSSGIGATWSKMKLY